jgi:hypothetical protein
MLRRSSPPLHFLALLAALAPAAVAAPTAGAQPPRARADSLDTPALPRDVARDVAARFNAPAATRAFGRYEVAAGATVAGDLAVLDGPLVIAGHVAGRVTAVNADVTFRPGARVDGDLLVVGGVVEGRLDADVRGEYVRFRQPLRYTRLEDRLVPDADEEENVGSWFRWRRADAERGRRTTLGLTLSSGGTYNRVEGLPIHVGPSLEHDFGAGRVRVDLLGIFRTAEQFSWDGANLGHVARAELRLGRGLQARLGGRLYDQVAPVETWQLSGTESGLAAFLARRDFRDYYGRHGGAAYASLFAGPDASLTLSLADERWAARGVRDVFTLFRNSATWRPNPAGDEGRLHLFNATLRIDTRNDEDNPWAGWYVEADYERGAGGFTGIAPTSASLPGFAGGAPAPGALGARDLTPGRRTYGRGFLDLRRYNRLAPDAQLNFRLVLGGWLHGDELPMQRRFSVTGPGALPGFDFRQPATVGGERSEVGVCAVDGIEPAGSPAQCERVALAQVEYRYDQRVRLFGDDAGDGRGRRRALRTDLSWVLFADAGRGWLLGPRDAGRQVYPSGRLPGLGSFLADVGAGVDFGNNRASRLASVGLYVAKAVTRPSPGANVIVRVRRRF